VAVVAAIFQQPIARFFLHGASAAPVVLAAIAAGGTVLLLRSLQVRYQLAGRFGRYGAVELLHTALRVGLIVVLLQAGVNGAGPLMVAYAVAPLVVLAVFGRELLQPRRLDAWWQPAQLRAIARFTASSLATCGVGAVVARLDLLVLAAVGQPDQLGLFGIASTVAMVPMLFGAYLAPSLTPKIVPYCRDGRFASLFTTTQAWLLVTAIAALAAVVVAAPLLIPVLLPESYVPAIPVVQVLVISGMAAFVTFPLTLHFLLFFSPRTYLTMDLISLPVLIAAYVYAARYHGAFGVACVTATAAALKSAIAQALALRLIPRVRLAPAALPEFS
jgi:O-antigen/teichoic acid export membrane protein